MSFTSAFARRVAAPAAAASISAWSFSKTSCETTTKSSNPQDFDSDSPKPGFQPDAEGDFYNLFPKRQLWQPKVEYPLWDANWDGRQPASTGDAEADRARTRKIRKEGTTRHILLIRHGQYDETHSEDELRKLTDLGRLQADYTGKRIAEMMREIIVGEEEDGESSTPCCCNVKVVRVSNMARAKETADIISSHLPASVVIAEPDPDLNEGRPAHNIPGGKASSNTVSKTDESHPRIERAFQRYFQRAGWSEEDESDDNPNAPRPKHEFEIIVCHANVIRYFTMRALQLPPEAWLRLCTFNCSLTYLTIRPTGTVSCRMLGDIGHMPYSMQSFSGHHGYNW